MKAYQNIRFLSKFLLIFSVLSLVLIPTSISKAQQIHNNDLAFLNLNIIENNIKDFILTAQQNPHFKSLKFYNKDGNVINTKLTKQILTTTFSNNSQSLSNFILKNSITIDAEFEELLPQTTNNAMKKNTHTFMHNQWDDTGKKYYYSWQTTLSTMVSYDKSTGKMISLTPPVFSWNPGGVPGGKSEYYNLSVNSKNYTTYYKVYASYSIRIRPTAPEISMTAPLYYYTGITDSFNTSK